MCGVISNAQKINCDSLSKPLDGTVKLYYSSNSVQQYCTNKQKKGVPKTVNIRDERKARGWTLQYVADQVGVTKSTVLEYEKGRCEPSLDVYCNLMSLFGYKVPRLVFGEASGEPPSADSVPQQATPSAKELIPA